MKYQDDINDNEIRLIGGSQQDDKPKRKWWVVMVIAFAVAVITTVIVVVALHNRQPESETIEGVYDPQPSAAGNPHPLRSWLQSYDSTEVSGCAVKDTIVNDIAVHIYLPLNAHPELEIGTQCLNDNKVILAFQAADIRADNKKIVGAFVEKGKPVAWGLSKKGYCAILPNRDADGSSADSYKIYVGMADNSPLFEEATDCGGYFFRQYPLVASGKPQESELKSQSVRRALCDVDNHICVVETQEKAGMHDFAVLLADLGVDNAVYLIGSDAMGIVTDLNGNRTALGRFVEKPFKNINFIYWRKD